MNGIGRSVLLAVAALGTALLLAGCASGRSSVARADRCKGQTLDPMFSQGRAVFRACDVDRPARMITYLQSVLMSPSGTGSIARCSSAELEFVVDERGVPQGDKIRTVRSTSSELLDQMRRAVPQLQYAPALKDGQPVLQVVRFSVTRSVTVGVVRSGAPPAPTRAPSC